MRRASTELRKMVAHYGLATVRAYMGHVQDNAADAVQRVIAKLKNSRFEVETDQGSVIKVAIKIDRKKKTRPSTSPARASRRKTRSMRRSRSRGPACSMYSARLVDDDIPLNAGCLRRIKIVVPKGSMLKPRYPAAVAGGNVETSQTVVNCLYGALGVLGSAQGHDEQSYLRQ